MHHAAAPLRSAPLVRGRCTIAGALALGTFAVFIPALWNRFLDWDDYIVTSNPAYHGFGAAQLRWIFTSFVAGHYMPLTWLTFSVDHALWGLNPLGYHLTNLLLHAGNVIVFFFLAQRLLRAATSFSGSDLSIAASTAALFFAVHPLRVESVAWVTERRDVLSALLFLLTILHYVAASEVDGARRRRLLATSIGTYFLALLSKTFVMTLPAVLILLDVFPLRRLPGSPQRWLARPSWSVWAEKVPYAVLGLLAASLAWAAVVTKGYESSFERYPWPVRASMAAHSLWFYLYKTVLPLDLSPLYELPDRVHPLDPAFLASILGVAGVTAMMIRLRARWPAGLAIWGYYAIVVAPVSGLAHAGLQLVADRYSYLSCLGWALAVGAGVGSLAGASRAGRIRPSLARGAAGAVVAGFVGLAALTWQQVHVWRDTETLWRHAVAATPDCAICHVNLATELVNRGAVLSALGHFQQAVVLRPELVQARLGAGMAFTRLGLLPEAIEQYERVLARYPEAVFVQNRLAEVLLRSGRPRKALGHLRRAVAVGPNHAGVHTNLGRALTALGQPAAAVGHFQRAIALQPRAAPQRVGLVRAYLALGKLDLARRAYEALRAVDPAAAYPLAGAFQPVS